MALKISTNDLKSTPKMLIILSILFCRQRLCPAKLALCARLMRQSKLEAI